MSPQFLTSSDPKFKTLEYHIPRMRAWHKKDKTMYLICAWSNAEWMGSGYLSTVEHFKIWRERDYLEWVIPDEIIVMRASGLRDEIGLDIFEGDIIECLDNIVHPDGQHVVRGEVYFDQETGIFMIKYFDTEVEEQSSWERKILCVEFEPHVIGNIYEDKDLLKKKKSKLPPLPM